MFAEGIVFKSRFVSEREELTIVVFKTTVVDSRNLFYSGIFTSRVQPSPGAVLISTVPLYNSALP